MQGINRIKDEGRLGKQERPFGTEVAAINLLISPQNPRPRDPWGGLAKGVIRRTARGGGIRFAIPRLELRYEPYFARL
jgi:hypothetical protein